MNRAAYELGFMRHNYKAARLLQSHVASFEKPKLCVIGIRGGLDRRWKRWQRNNLIDATGVEADAAECARLSQLTSMVLYPFALGDRSGETPFYETEFSQCSSCLEPDSVILKPYSVAPLFEVKKVSSVRIHRFDELVPGTIPGVPDFLQIDVQGFEYQVLEGFGLYLDTVLCLEIESHFKPLYKGQKCLGEMKNYLDAKGFFLRHIQIQGPFDGEVVEQNLFFVREDCKLDGKQRGKQRSLIHLWEHICELPKRTGVGVIDKSKVAAIQTLR